MKNLIDSDAIRQPMSAVSDLVDQLPSVQLPEMPAFDRISLPDTSNLPDVPALSDIGSSIADGAIVVGRRGSKIARSAGRAGRRVAVTSARGARNGAVNTVRVAREHPKAALATIAGLLAFIGVFAMLRRRNDVDESRKLHLADAA